MNLNELISNYTINKTSKITKILEPLTLISGIQGFFRYTISKKGHFTFIGTHPSWNEEYYEKKYYLHNPFLCHPSSLQEGIHFSNANRNEQYLEMLNLRRKRIDADHTMLLIDKNMDGIEAFGFFTTTQNSQVYNFYANEMPLLRSFIGFFKSEFSNDLISMMRYPANLLEAKKELFFPKENKNHITPSARYNFLKAVDKNINIDWLLSIKLSHREKQLLRLLKKGKTAQEIAAKLFISPRSVEKYIENVKDKFRCKRRSEIFDHLEEAELLGLL